MSKPTDNTTGAGDGGQVNGLGAWLIATLAAGALYLGTMAPGVAWGDSGDAQVRVALGQLYDRTDLSRSHVPYYVLATAMSRLGIESARAANLVSAVAGALIIGNVAWILTMLVRRRAAVACGVFLLMFSHALWHLATVAEVMTLSVMLLSLELGLIVKFVRSRRPAWLVSALLVNGLGLATHNMSLLIWPAYVVLLVVCARTGRSVSRRALAAGAVAMLIGASPLIYVFVHGRADHGSAYETLHAMLSGRYTSHVFNSALSVRAVMRMAGYSGYSFPSPVALLSIPGLWVFWRWRERGLRWFFVIALAGYFGFAIRYSVPDQHTFMLHGYLFGVILAAIGVDHLCAQRPSSIVSGLLVALSLLGPVVYASVPELLRQRFPDAAPIPKREVRYRDNFDWFLKPWHGSYEGPERFAREVFEDLPENALLVIDSTLRTPLLYVQAADDFRRDVEIVNAAAYQRWRSGFFDLASPERDLAVGDGRLFTVTDDRRYVDINVRSDRYAFVPRGAVFRVVHAP